MSIINEINEAMQKGKKKQVTALVEQALSQGVPAQTILNEGLLAAMDVVGQKFRENQVFVPEVLVAARAMSAGTEMLKPHLGEGEGAAIGKACIGTVAGDMHDIGKNLCRMMMEGKGIEVIDLGVDVSAEQFVQCAVENDCDLICCSALLTTTMPVMADIVKAVRQAGLSDKVKIMVGGAPVTQAFCDEIGADCYTPDAASCAIKAAELVTA